MTLVVQHAYEMVWIIRVNQVKGASTGQLVAVCHSDGSTVSVMWYNDESLVVIEYGMLSGIITGPLIKWSKDREIKWYKDESIVVIVHGC